MSMMMPGPKQYNFMDKILEAIRGELHDYRYYTVLAERVTDEEDKKLITGFANDEFHHAENLTTYYQCVTGMMVPPYTPEVSVPADLGDAYAERIRAEVSDYEKYRDWYLMASDPRIRDLFFQIMTDENEHALSLLLLLHEYHHEMMMHPMP